MKLNLKLYRSSCLLLTLLLTLFRCLSMTALYNPQLGYFQNSILPLAMNVIYVLSAIWFLSAIKLLPKSTIKAEFTPELPHFKWASGTSAVLLIVSLVLVFTRQSNSKFIPLILLTLALSTLFFISVFVKGQKSDMIRAFSSIAFTALFMCILAAVYFDLTIAMNSPHKIIGSFALMASMIFTLCETRIYLGKALSRLHLAMSMLTFTISASMVLSSICYIIGAAPSEFVKNPITLGNTGYILVIAATAVYALSRCFSFTEPTELTELKEQNDALETQAEPSAEE